MPEKAADIDEYIATAPEPSRETLRKIRATVKKVEPTATEAISYAIPLFKLDGKPLIYMAGYAKHVSLHPRSDAMDVHFQKEFAKYADGQGTIKFMLDEPIPYDLIERIVAFRAEKLREQA